MIPALGLLIPAKVKRIIMVAGLVLFVALASGLTGYCEGKKAERGHWEALVAEVARKAAVAQRQADANLRRAETAETALINGNRQEINNALANLPDQALSARQRAIVCVRLRREGGSASAIAAACGPAQSPR